MEPAVFLDRDNTLIANDGDLGDPDAVRLLDGVPEGLKALREAGFRLIVVTNQGGVARGVYGEDDVDAVHQRIAHLIDEAARATDLIDRFYYCPYHPDAVLDEYRRDHSWRKPQPGMLLQAARDMKLDLGGCWMVGDQARDIAAGRSAGCRTVMIGANGDAKATRPTVATTSFTEAVQAILRAAPARPPAPAPASPPVPAAPAANEGGNDPADGPDGDTIAGLRQALRDLTEEMRSDRQRRGEFTALRLSAGLLQLFSILLALLGLLQLSNSEVFIKWAACAIFAQLITIALLMVDGKG